MERESGLRLVVTQVEKGRDVVFEGYLVSLDDHPDRAGLLDCLRMAAPPSIRGPFPDISRTVPGPPSHDAEPLVCLDTDRLQVHPAYDGTRAPMGSQPTRLRDNCYERLLEAQDGLPGDLGLTVLDGWRSWAFQHKLTQFYGGEAVAGGYVSPTDAPDGFVPPHVTGGAVDVTLSWAGVPLALGTDFDSFRPRAHADALEGVDSAARSARRLLFHALTGVGFAPYPYEWWHYSYGDNHWATWCGVDQPLYGAAAPQARQR